MNDVDEKELESQAIKDGEIDPDAYSPKWAGCLSVASMIFGVIVAMITILGWLAG